MTAIVLAGGKSVRLGRNKAFETIGGESLIGRVIRRLALLASEIIVVTAHDQGDLHIPSHPGVKRVVDLYRDSGPLAGIHSGLTEASSFRSLTVACDMPFLNQPLLRYMTALALDFDAVVPCIDGQLEPLHAVYSKACLPHIEELLKEGDYRVTDLMLRVKVRYVEEGEIDQFDPQHLSFLNVNAQADLDKARTMVR